MSDKPVLRTPAELLTPYRDLARYLVLAKTSQIKGVAKHAREAAKLLKALEAELDGIYAETRDDSESAGSGELFHGEPRKSAQEEGA
jgi:hypothetical protein